MRPDAARSVPAAQRCHVGLDPRLVDEDQAGRIDPALVGFPARPLTRDVGAILFGWQDGFF